MIIEYIIPVVYTPEDNESYINKDLLLIKDCSQLTGVNSECDGYNFNKCPNDDSYCQPFIKGDIIKLQFNYDKTKYFKAFVEFINTETMLPETVVFTTETGVDAELNDYLNVFIDTDQAIFDTLTCWYLKLKLYGCKLEGLPAYNLCVDEKLVGGLTLYEAQAECYEEQCEIAAFITSEPYCIVACNEETLMICGSYTKYDCEGNYYGNFILPNGKEAPNKYSACFRVRGRIEPDGYEFEKTTNVLKVVKSQQKQRFIMYLKPVPYYVAKQIALCFNSQQLTIDGIVYTGSLKLNKNFDEGSMWIIKENIFIDCDEISFTCK